LGRTFGEPDQRRTHERMASVNMRRLLKVYGQRTGPSGTGCPAWVVVQWETFRLRRGERSDWTGRWVFSFPRSLIPPQNQATAIAGCHSGFSGGCGTMLPAQGRDFPAAGSPSLIGGREPMADTNESLDNLIPLARDGDMAALGQLLESYRGYLRHL